MQTMTVVDELTERLREILPPDRVLADRVSLHLYKYDGAQDEALPEAVVLPETADEVVAVVKACAARGVPFTPRGAGTSLSGGPLPMAGGVVIGHARMNQILAIDYDNLYAVVQPGVVNLDLQNAVAKAGYFYAPDPASEGVCTLGGNVAENSGGPHCLKYGVTTNHILGLEVVLPTGQMLHTGGPTRDQLGYDLTGLLVGSEGTLGVVTQITCRIMPLPETVTTILAIFNDLNDASQAVSNIIADGLVPASLEMMDRLLIQAVEKSMQAGYPLDAEAVLIIDIDGLQAGMTDQTQRIKAACQRSNVRDLQMAESEDQRIRLWRGRKGAFGAVAHLAPSKLTTDIAVPRTVLPEVLAKVMELGEKYDIPIGNVFHAGDGNLHPQVLFDPRDADQVRRVHQVDDELIQLAVDYGGVLTGEHGIGSQKRKWMPRMFGYAELTAMQQLKDVFDPNYLCNPAKVLPEAKDFPAPETLSLPEGDFQHAAEAVCVQGEDNTWQPYDYEAVAKLLAVANRTGQPIVIRGAGTKLETLSQQAEVVSTLSLDKIIELNTENLTATVQAGVGLAELNQALAQEGQMLPLRPPHYDRATVGGVIATADSGPHRLLYRAPRDLVTGLRAVLADGRQVKFGGASVKNVSGYAMERLFVGSQGTLGVIVEVTMRTLPLPERRETFMLAATSPDAFASLLRELRSSIMRPAAVELLNPAAAFPVNGPTSPDDWTMFIGLEGLAVEVTEQLQLLAAATNHHSIAGRHLEAPGYDQLWQQVTELGSRGPERRCVHLACHPSEVCRLAEGVSLIMQQLGQPAPVTAAANLGIVRISLPRDKDLLLVLATEIPRVARDCGAKFTGMPADFAAVADIQLNPVTEQLLRQLKASFDPHGILPSLCWADG